MKRSCSMPFGTEIGEDGSIRFRLWAPKAKRVDLCLEGSATTFPLEPVGGGWYELRTHEAHPGACYRFQIDGGTRVPDPASRFQPQDVNGPSEIVNPQAFEWQDESWMGRAWEEAVIYELHVGAFTSEGTFRALAAKLDYLADLGVTAVELMPVGDFPGQRNWGYDGVLPYAPDSSYGRPEDLKRLVQAAHAKGLMVFLDVVYNHFGPEGNYLHLYAPEFFTKRHHTPWGEAINFDGAESRAVRDFFIWNAIYWLQEYHFDGLRLDAVHAMVDDSEPDFLTELAQTIRHRFGEKRYIHLILENDDNAAHYLERDAEKRAELYNAQWDDDFHHIFHVLVTGESDGYYADYSQRPVGNLCRCLTEGFMYQGEYSPFRHRSRGEPSARLPLSAFIFFLQNHDQVGNRAFGERIGQLASPDSVRAAMEILLLAPFPPLLFMGEEFGAATPFLYFCDFFGKLAAAVTQGRRTEFAHFAKFSSEEARTQIPDPNSLQSFLRSKLDWGALSRHDHVRWLTFYRELLSVRHTVILPMLGRLGKAATEFCNEQHRTFRVSWTVGNEERLAVIANLSTESHVLSANKVSSPIHASSPAAAIGYEQGLLPPWSVVWRLESAARR